MKTTPTAIPKNGISSSGDTARSSTSAFLPAGRQQPLREVEPLLGLGQLAPEGIHLAAELPHLGLERGLDGGGPPRDPVRQSVAEAGAREDQETPDQHRDDRNECFDRDWLHRRLEPRKSRSEGGPAAPRRPRSRVYVTAFGDVSQRNRPGQAISTARMWVNRTAISVSSTPGGRRYTSSAVGWVSTLVGMPTTSWSSVVVIRTVCSWPPA